MRKSKRAKQKFSAVVSNNWFVLKQVARHTPWLFVGFVVEAVAMGALNSGFAYFNYFLLNEVSSPMGEFAKAALMIGVMAVSMLIAYAINKWFWFVFKPMLEEKLHSKLHEELFQKAQKLDLACFDDPEFYTDFVWAMDEANQRAMWVVQDTGQLISRLISSVSLFGLMLSVDAFIAVLLLVSSIVSIVCDTLGNRVHYEQEKEMKPLWRKNGYINRVYHLADYAKEMRSSDTNDLMMAEFDKNNVKITEVQIRCGKKYFLLYGLGFGLMQNVTFYGTLLYMIFKLKAGLLTIGGFAAAVQVVWNIRWQITDLIERITKFPMHSLYIEKWRGFLRFEPAIVGERTALPPFESLEFRDVSFTYEFSAHPKYRFHDADHQAEEQEGSEALRHVNLTIKAGDKVAIVGYNGAGKTTLIKLMMRLYDPTEGVILYNGVDIREYDPATYRKHIGTVFQDYKLFATTVAHNVMNGEYDENAHRDIVLDALDKSDFTEKLSKLEQGIDTHLTREFKEDGTNLSGGEAQKVAIARVFAADYPIVIMDEPSSALDPMAEYQLNQSILHHTQDKTVVFISHRLSTTRIADTIYMFDTGKLVEQGSHEELLAQDGKYAEMFRLQSEKYEGSSADG